MVSTYPCCYTACSYVLFFSLSSVTFFSLAYLRLSAPRCFSIFNFPHLLLPLSSSSTSSSIILLPLHAFSLLFPCLFFLSLLFFSNALYTNSSSSYFFIFLFLSSRTGRSLLPPALTLSVSSFFPFPIRLFLFLFLIFASNSFRFSSSYSS